MNPKLLTRLPQDYEIIEAQMDRYRRASQGHEKWAEMAKICTQFFEGEQWTEAEMEILKTEGRPCITKNKIAPLVRLLLGYFRQNRYDINFMPGGDGTGIDEIAETLTAVAKQIAEANQSDWNDAQVFQDGLFTGRGFYDLRLNFARNRLGECAERVIDPFSAYIDPEADTYDPNDQQGGWNFFIENRWMSPVDIYTLYGDKAMGELESLGKGFPITSGDYYDGGQGDISPPRFFGLEEYLREGFTDPINYHMSPFEHVNRHRKLIRVLDCQHRVLKKVRYFVDLETGQEKILSDSVPMWRLQAIMQYVESRGLPIALGTGLKKVVRWTTTAADRVLYDDWSPYDTFTVVPFFPYFRRGKTRGVIEDLLDPQREINRRSSAMLHIIMSTANSGWIFEKGSLEEDMQRALEEEGARPGIHIEYNEGYNAPQKIQPSATPMNMKKLEDDATSDLKEISGITDSALGQIDKVQSGRAIQARQKQTIVGAEPYFDNFSRSRELKGRKIAEIVQNFYTEPRILRIRGERGDTEEIFLNRRDAAGEIINNVTVGRYDVAVDEAPVSSTFMQGQFEEALELLEKGIPIPPDILVDLSSMPRKQEIKERLTEDRIQGEVMKRLEALGVKMNMGIPPEMPVPPVVADGGPNVIIPNQQPLVGTPPPGGGPVPQPQMVPGAPPPVMPVRQPPGPPPLNPEERLVPTMPSRL